MITLNTCISLRVPKIEDGNNFGVTVQATVKEYIQNVRSANLDTMKAYPLFHQDRAKRLSKILKYPN
eukprot:UN31776